MAYPAAHGAKWSSGTSHCLAGEFPAEEVEDEGMPSPNPKKARLLRCPHLLVANAPEVGLL